MMAGLTVEERRQLGLAGYSIRDIRYLSQGTAELKSQKIHEKLSSEKRRHLFASLGDTRSDEAEDAERFKTWKSNLGILGIPYMDVLR
jgi:hypothetical protein